MKFLVVEDDRVLNKVVTKYLNGLNYDDIINAFDGEEGLKLFNQESPDVVITDVCMPNMDGHAMIEAILKDHENPKVIVMTSLDDDATFLASALLSSSEQLNKPFRQDDLQAAIARVCG